MNNSNNVYPNKRRVGKEAEERALRYLKEKGLVWVQSNYFSRFGEIDLIMMDKNWLVFIEVKLRKKLSYGTPEEAVNKLKQHRMVKTAAYYLLSRKIHDRPVRFDVVSIHLDQIEHIENAFYSEGNYY